MLKKNTQLKQWHRIISLVLLMTIAGILVAGLWPFNFFQTNRVSQNFNNQTSYLIFKKHSHAFFSPPLNNFKTTDGYSVEIDLKPSHLLTNSIPRILSIYDKNREIFIIGQWRSGIIFRIYDENSPSKMKEFYYKDAFTSKERVKIFMSTSINGSSLYLNGKNVYNSENALLPASSEFNGTIVLGNTVFGDQGWDGELYSVHFFNYPLSEHLMVSENNKNPFTFAKSCYELNVPKHFIPLKLKFLTPPWIDFQPNRWYFLDVVLNFLGFIPLGLLLGLLVYPQKCHHYKTLYIAFLVSAIVSFKIELLQTLLPSRTSQLSDLILNTIGGISGALVSIRFMKRKKTQ